MVSRNRDRVTRCTSASAVAGIAAIAAWIVIAQSGLAGQGGDVTVRGCVERDAAASSPIFKLVTPAPVKIYRLTAPKEIDVAAHVGHTVDITGAVSADPPGRSSSRESELVVKKLSMVSDKCGAAVPEFRSSAVR